MKLGAGPRAQGRHGAVPLGLRTWWRGAEGRPGRRRPVSHPHDAAGEEAFEFSCSHGVLELSDGLGFDLSDAFAGDFEDSADFFEGVGIAVADAVAELDDFAFAVGEGFEDLLDFVLEHFLCGGFDGVVGFFVFDEVAEVAVFGLADGSVEGDGVSADFEDASGFADAHFGAFGDFLDGGLASDLLHDLFGDIAELAHRFDHVDGDADGAGVIGDGACDGLSYPPGGVGAELVSAAVLVFIDGAHEAGVSFLDDVEEGEAAVAVLLGDGDDESEVPAGEFAFGVFVFVVDFADDDDAAVEVLGVFEDEVFEAGEFLLADLHVFTGVFDFLELFDACFEFEHLGGDAGELLHQRGDPAGAEGEFLEEFDAASASASDGQHEVVVFLFCFGGSKGLPVFAVATEHVSDGFEVHGDALADGGFVGLVLGGADFHGAVEGEVAVVDLLEDFDCGLEAVIAFEDARAEDLSGDFDFFGEADFLLAGEQGDLAHLGEIHSDGVVDAFAGCFGELFFEIEVDFLFLFVGQVFGSGLIRAGRLGGRLGGGQQRGCGGCEGWAFWGFCGFLLVFGDIHVVDEFDAHLIDHHEQGVEFIGGDDFVGEAFIEFVVGQVAARFAEVDEGGNAQIDFFLRTGANQRSFDNHCECTTSVQCPPGGSGGHRHQRRGPKTSESFPISATRQSSVPRARHPGGLGQCATRRSRLTNTRSDGPGIGSLLCLRQLHEQIDFLFWWQRVVLCTEEGFHRLLTLSITSQFGQLFQGALQTGVEVVQFFDFFNQFYGQYFQILVIQGGEELIKYRLTFVLLISPVEFGELASAGLGEILQVEAGLEVVPSFGL